MKHQQKAAEKAATHVDNEGCTFKPKILNKKFNNKKSDLDKVKDAMNEERGGDKWMELYKMADRKKGINKQDKNKDEIEFLKNPEEYTFQPNAHKYKDRLMSPKVKRQAQT